jgi:hypothetical protein
MVCKHSGPVVSRTGAILVIVLISLLVAMVLGGELIKATVVRHRQTRLAEQRQQSFWLAESAVQRALHALSESPDYEGETWRVSGEYLAGGLTGLAVISVKPSGEAGQGRLIRVEAHYPDDPVHRTLYERELLVD